MSSSWKVDARSGEGSGFRELSKGAMQKTFQVRNHSFNPDLIGKHIVFAYATYSQAETLDVFSLVV